MLTLYITRHGETEWNTQERMQGWKDSDLTEIGVQNAIDLGERLQSTPIDAIYSSPSNRTQKTTKLICGNRNIPIILDEDLREINMGIWEGKTQSYIKENYPTEHNNFWNAPRFYNPMEGESFFDVQRRVLTVLNRMKSDKCSGNVLIVTHSVVIKCLLSIFKDLPIENIWDPPYIHDTSLTIVEVNEKGYRILLEGDTLHKETARS
ncbi:histidine phosphatase family protein [Psychrobacillus sp. FSL H8-0484]|uniref:histidine phosphatase family protein n=1 Tax=Psychrobacillus sp. FSL H8-0484 TaxID=2921390 RepID=UPI0030F4CB7B